MGLPRQTGKGLQPRRAAPTQALEGRLQLVENEWQVAECGQSMSSHEAVGGGGEPGTARSPQELQRYS